MRSTRWVLAFSRRCPKCVRLATRVEQIAEGRLQAEPLNAPSIEAARREAFGAEPPWTPTLLAFEDRRVRAWTGFSLTVRLARLLGPRRALRVLRELRSPSEPAGDPRRRGVSPPRP